MTTIQNAIPGVAQPVLSQLSATPEAKQALSRIAAEHGPVMFHTSGGRVGGRTYPICLPLKELRLGARDHLLGEFDGVPIYGMEDRDGGLSCAGHAYVLDVVQGLSIGFSIVAAPGMRFTLREVAPSATCAVDNFKASSGGSV